MAEKAVQALQRKLSVQALQQSAGVCTVSDAMRWLLSDLQRCVTVLEQEEEAEEGGRAREGAGERQRRRRANRSKRKERIVKEKREGR